MRTLCYTAPEKDAGRTVKSVLEEELHISSSLISRLKRREGGIAVNGEKAYTTRRLLPGDRVTARVGASTWFSVAYSTMSPTYLQ